MGVLALGGATGAHGQNESADGADPSAVSVPTLRTTITQRHPADYYVLASRLFGHGEKDEAVFWFYAGQLRFRALNACHPEQASSGGAALLSALQSSVGQVMNEYIGGYPRRWAATIRQAIAWDETNPDGPETDEACADAVAEQRTGARDLSDRIERSPDEIRAQRTANGLPNFEEAD